MTYSMNAAWFLGTEACTQQGQGVAGERWCGSTPFSPMPVHGARELRTVKAARLGTARQKPGAADRGRANHVVLVVQTIIQIVVQSVLLQPWPPQT